MQWLSEFREESVLHPNGLTVGAVRRMVAALEAERVATQ